MPKTATRAAGGDSKWSAASTVAAVQAVAAVATSRPLGLTELFKNKAIGVTATENGRYQ
jgi:hypothetical protein